MQIDGNAAIVTGGASGLGEATVRHLSARGAAVVIFDRDAERGTAIASELGDRCAYVAGDVLSEADTGAAVEAAAGLGPLRILVACAGGASRSERTLGRDGTPRLSRTRQTLDQVVANEILD